jgi:hypothetical protein
MPTLVALAVVGATVTAASAGAGDPGVMTKTYKDARGDASPTEINGKKQPRFIPDVTTVILSDNLRTRTVTWTVKANDLTNALRAWPLKELVVLIDTKSKQSYALYAVGQNRSQGTSLSWLLWLARLRGGHYVKLPTKSTMKFVQRAGFVRWTLPWSALGSPRAVRFSVTATAESAEGIMWEAIMESAPDRGTWLYKRRR